MPGANPDVQDKWKESPLIKCVYERGWEGFLMLLAKKADVNLTSPRWARRCYAAGHGEIVMLNLLVRMART